MKIGLKLPSINLHSEAVCNVCIRLERNRLLSHIHSDAVHEISKRMTFYSLLHAKSQQKPWNGLCPIFKDFSWYYYWNPLNRFFQSVQSLTLLQLLLTLLNRSTMCCDLWSTGGPFSQYTCPKSKLFQLIARSGSYP